MKYTYSTFFGQELLFSQTSLFSGQDGLTFQNGSVWVKTKHSPSVGQWIEATYTAYNLLPKIIKKTPKNKLLTILKIFLRIYKIAILARYLRVSNNKCKNCFLLELLSPQKSVFQNIILCR